MVELVKLNVTSDNPNWCPGCGDFGIMQGFKKAISELGIDPAKTVICAGIGCSSKLPQWVNTYGIHTLHGRSLPVAQGIKLANSELTVFADGGDGDGYGIGMGHLIHAMRRNVDITYVVHNNQIYGLTKGQASPTTDHKMKTISTPSGVVELPINPLTMAISAECSFVARSYAGDIQHLTEMIKAGVAHKGFALIDVMQPCVTYNKQNTYEYFAARVYDLAKKGHNASNKEKAMIKAMEHELDDNKVPIGIFYQVKRPTYGEELTQTGNVPLVKHEIQNVDVEACFEEKY